MPRIIFSAEYEVFEDKLDEFREKISRLKTLQANKNYEYIIYENKKKKNHFIEFYFFKSEEDFEKFDDSSSDEINDLVYDITTNYVVNKKVTYKTLVEVL